jgi:hypothetical protein
MVDDVHKHSTTILDYLASKHITLYSFLKYIFTSSVCSNHPCIREFSANASDIEGLLTVIMSCTPIHSTYTFNWATRMVIKRCSKELENLSRKNMGLHFSEQDNSMDSLLNFRMDGLNEKIALHGPTVSLLLSSLMRPPANTQNRRRSTRSSNNHTDNCENVHDLVEQMLSEDTMGEDQPRNPIPKDRFRVQLVRL